ncbi:hypothetical protein D8I24_6511 [Cupriavidus necator H850]|uniref:hypothetical protein n=1 Tax=Cupriavidus necator TaxID=106590 RepID=UPI00129EFD26|nr:hypothetical protein [Cupriavidus necator]KAI3597695.1 hypothetical protein D8I24_6511 [Cupriavidus necator H850]
MSAVRISINSAEFDALEGESDELFRLYVGAIRPRMNFATGVVGQRPHLSYQGLKEWTERRARPGVKYLAHDKSKLHRMLARLQTIGLLRRIGRAGDLVFACPLADRDSARPKQADTKLKQGGNARKPSRSKGSRDLSTKGKNAEVATHPESGNTYTPPSPPRDADAGGSGASVHPAPHACGAWGKQDPQHQHPADTLASGSLHDATASEGSANPPPHADGVGGELGPQHPRATAQQLSEECHEHENGGGEGPPAQLSERGVGALEWEDHLAWPVRVTPEQRAYLAQVKREEGETLLQRVLDELRGAVASVPGGIKDEWAYFHVLLRNAKEKGDAWQTVYAEKIALARQNVARTMAQQKAEDAAYAASIGGVPGYPGKGELRKLVRGGAQR